VKNIFILFPHSSIDILTRLCYTILVVNTTKDFIMETRFEMFTVLIAKANRCIHRLKTEEMTGYHLKSSHVSCLYYLYKVNALTAKELCGLCGEDKANISRAIKYLESEGYVYCEMSAKKRYQSALLLTEKGKRIGENLSKKIDEILIEASAGLTEENRQIFYQSLSLICDNLEKICMQYGE